MTETAPVTHCDVFGQNPGAVGQLVPSTECRIAETVCDETGAITDVAGPGTPGELLIRGPQVMLGYLNNEEATKATLLPDGWLRTGDIALAHDDGLTFSVVDRIKELIKVKGLQVSPAELEGLLLQHPHVADAAVVAKPCERNGELPHAFVQTKPGFDLDNLLSFINTQVAPFKQLSTDRVSQVPAIPKSPSGKILRRQLQAEFFSPAP